MWDGSEFLQPAGLIVVGRKMPMSQSLKPADTLPHLEKGTLQEWLRISKWKNYPRFSQLAPGITTFFKRAEGSENTWQWKQGSEREKEILRCYVTGLKMEERTPRQGMQAASRNWKRAKRKWILLSSLQECCPCQTLAFSPVKPISDSWPPKLSNTCVVSGP